MEKTAAKLFKKFDKNYKYVFFVVLVGLVFAIFNGIGSEPSVANEQVYPEQTTTQNETSAKDNSTVTTGQSDPELSELEQIVASDNSTKQGQVLSAGSENSAIAINPNNSAYQNFEAMFYTAVDILPNSLLGSEGRIYYNAQDGKSYEYRTATGAMPQLLSLTGTLYQEKPVSVEVWANDIKSRVNPDVYAQNSLDSDTYNPGQGYDLLSPIQGLWRAGVNLVYVLYILIIVFLAFLILFRSQLGGQETVTLFNAIPSLIISLVLVYFSYPISALFIDLVTVGSGTVYGALIGEDENSDAPGSFLYTQSVTTNDGDDPASGVIRTILGSESVDPKTGLQVDDKYVNVWQIFGTAGVSPTGEDIETIVPKDVPIANQLENVIGNIAGSGITDSILKLVFTFAAFSASLKLFFSLLRSYVFMMVMPLASPFIFLVAAIPGQTSSVTQQYFGRLLASALSFIAVYTVFLVIIIIAKDNTTPGEVTWVPPLLGYSAGQTISGSDITNLARPLIAYSLFISTPMIPDYIFELLQQNNQSPFAQNIADTTKQGARTLLGFGTAGYRQLQGTLGTAPEAGR